MLRITRTFIGNMFTPVDSYSLGSMRSEDEIAGSLILAHPLGIDCRSTSIGSSYLRSLPHLVLSNIDLIFFVLGCSAEGDLKNRLQR